MSGRGGAGDLSGDWLGFYNYSLPCPPTQFEATIRDAGGLITGITTEIGDSPDCQGMVLQAVIEGRREGATLRFVKTYDYLERAPDPVRYEGTIQAEGDEVEGRWTIRRVWSGTFMMMRRRREAAEDAIKVEEDVPLGR
jgi:hypothetical protein